MATDAKVYTMIQDLSEQALRSLLVEGYWPEATKQQLIALVTEGYEGNWLEECEIIGAWEDDTENESCKR